MVREELLVRVERGWRTASAVCVCVREHGRGEGGERRRAEELSQRELSRLEALLCRPSLALQMARASPAAARDPPPGSAALAAWAGRYTDERVIHRTGSYSGGGSSPLGSYSPRSERKPSTSNKRGAWVPG
jgi:hypothetical protein